MTTSEQAGNIAKEYLKKAGYDEFKIVQIEDKIYKWLVKVESSKAKFLLDISKVNGVVIQMIKQYEM